MRQAMLQLYFCACAVCGMLYKQPCFRWGCCCFNLWPQVYKTDAEIIHEYNKVSCNRKGKRDPDPSSGEMIECKCIAQDLWGQARTSCHGHRA